MDRHPQHARTSIVVGCLLGCAGLMVVEVHAQSLLPSTDSTQSPRLRIVGAHEGRPLTDALRVPWFGGDSYSGPVVFRERRTWQLLPDGLIYRSYLAGVKESRFASAWVHERELGWIWDIALGGRVGLLRYGTCLSDRPEGWQIDFEGAAFPRLDLEHGREVVATDFRAGVPLTYGCGRFQTKFAYYHLSSHLGDELMVRRGSLARINYVRDVLVWGASYYWTDDLRLYGEAGWAFDTDGGAEPWEFQFGIDYSPAIPSGLYGAPFFAINGHLREEVDFGGNLVVQAGWQWRGDSGHLFRAGMQYFTGKSDQFEFYDEYEEKLGLAIWYDY